MAGGKPFGRRDDIGLVVVGIKLSLVEIVFTIMSQGVENLKGGIDRHVVCKRIVAKAQHGRI